MPTCPQCGSAEEHQPRPIIPKDVYWDRSTDQFYDLKSDKNMGHTYYLKWRPHHEKFLQAADQKTGDILYGARKGCVHVLDPNNWSGIKCLKCPGWYCL